MSAAAPARQQGGRDIISLDAFTAEGFFGLGRTSFWDLRNLGVHEKGYNFLRISGNGFCVETPIYNSAIRTCMCKRMYTI